MTKHHVKTMKKCILCGNKLNIDAIHKYPITQDNEGKFRKSEGDVFYKCRECGGCFPVRVIEDVLKEVDEL